MLHRLETLFKWLFILSLLVALTTYFKKDSLPDPAFYDLTQLEEPLQRPTRKRPFDTQVNGQSYLITPLFDYELHGVVVSFNDSDSFTDTTHHRRWRDFLNIRDLCVIWGRNVQNGVYREMDFSNDSWTCWAYWPNAETRSRFSMRQLSNNHLLADDDELKRRLMSAQIGDHVRLKGVLASYANPGNGFKRGTSTVRTDTGNGACETIYLQEFEILNPANGGVRSLYALAKWLTISALAGFLLLFVVSPVRGTR
jgi:hypothetical protein